MGLAIVQASNVQEPRRAGGSTFARQDCGIKVVDWSWCCLKDLAMRRTIFNQGVVSTIDDSVFFSCACRRINWLIQPLVLWDFFSARQTRSWSFFDLTSPFSFIDEESGGIFILCLWHLTHGAYINIMSKRFAEPEVIMGYCISESYGLCQWIEVPHTSLQNSAGFIEWVIGESTISG